MLSVLIVVGLFAAFPGRWAWERKQKQDAAVALFQKKRAVYEERCKTVAGEKVYKAVPDVEGFLLLKVRPRVGDKEKSDILWPGAAFALEEPAEDHIKTFLPYENPLRVFRPFKRNEGGGVDQIIPITPQTRGQLGSILAPGGRPGYRWVGVIDEKDGKRYRYTASIKEVTRMTKGGVKKIQFTTREYVLDRVPAPSPPPLRGDLRRSRDSRRARVGACEQYDKSAGPVERRGAR